MAHASPASAWRGETRAYNVSVRVRGCGPIPMDFQVRTHCGGHSADGTFHKTCVEEYLEHTFAHERYKPSDGERPDLDYVPWHCPESIARATCPDGDDAPLLGSFTFVGHVIGPAIGGRSSLSLRSAVPDITALRNKHCLGAPVSNGRLALLGIELPTVWTAPRPLQLPSATPVDDGFPYVAPELKFTVPYSSTGYHVETKRGCRVWPAAPTPGTPRPLLAVYLGSSITRLREDLTRECAAAPDCTLKRLLNDPANRSLGLTRSEQSLLYLKGTFALQPWGDTMTRKAYWDALAAGAINVIFAQRHKVPDEVFADTLVGPHTAYTVTVPQDVWQKGHTLQYLRDIPAARVKQLQKEARRARHHAMFTAKGACYDAAFAIASGLAQQFRAYQKKRESNPSPTVVSIQSERVPQEPLPTATRAAVHNRSSYLFRSHETRPLPPAISRQRKRRPVNSTTVGAWPSGPRTTRACCMIASSPSE